MGSNTEENQQKATRKSRFRALLGLEFHAGKSCADFTHPGWRPSTNVSTTFENVQSLDSPSPWPVKMSLVYVRVKVHRLAPFWSAQQNKRRST